MSDSYRVVSPSDHDRSRLRSTVEANLVLLNTHINNPIFKEKAKIVDNTSKQLARFIQDQESARSELRMIKSMDTLAGSIYASSGLRSIMNTRYDNSIIKKLSPSADLDVGRTLRWESN